MVVEDELSSLNRELCMFPTRAFEFKHAGTVVIEQDVADVGSVVWDAEVLMAHYLDCAYGPQLMRDRRVVELGAGTGLAGIVAARLGASVLLTDQAKLLPTLFNNARSNAANLELRSSWPSSPPSPPPSAETHFPPSQRSSTTGGESERSKGANSSFAACAGIVDTSSRKNASLQIHGDDDASRVGGTAVGAKERGISEGAQEEEAGIRQAGGGSDEELWRWWPLRRSGDGDGDGNGNSDHDPGGTWRAAELLFSRNEDEVLRSAAAGWGVEEDGNTSPPPRISGESGFFDLVVAADVVYLHDLWDAMASTIKALLKPTGEALVTFEQRRSSVDDFFGPPRFGYSDADDDDDNHQQAHHCDDCWERGREVDLERDVVARERGLGNAARAARVRLFRMTRRTFSGG